MNALVTRQELKKLLDYDLLTGVFTRLVGYGGVARGSVAGYINSIDGYVRISVCGRNYLAHRLAFLYVLGGFPENDVDHINGIRGDNRWVNLRPATRTENNRNQRPRIDNTSGITGVHVYRMRKDGTQVWIAKIGCNSNPSTFAQRYFSTQEEAIEWRKEKELELNYHQNHGSVIDRRISESKQ